jgi:hypothetical protein
MNARTLGRGLAALTLVALVAGGCTPDPAPGPTPSPTPTVSATPTESDQEREQRLAYEAAEKSYRTFRAEYGRVMNAGGANTATKVMMATAGGPYLTEFVELAQAFHGLKAHSSGVEKIVYVRRVGYSSSSVALEVCEDSRSVKDYDKRGKVIGKGEIRTAQLEVRKLGSQWKLWSGEGDKVSSCD